MVLTSQVAVCVLAEIRILSDFSDKLLRGLFDMLLPHRQVTHMKYCWAFIVPLAHLSISLTSPFLEFPTCHLVVSNRMSVLSI